MARPSYAVLWREGSGPTRAGKLELSESALSLRGSGPGGALAQCTVPYGELTEVRIGRAPTERLHRQPTAILERRAAPPLSLTALNGLGEVFELAEALAELASAGSAAGERLVVIVPLRRGRAARARELIDAGPPFDLDELALVRHDVFVTEREVVFLFEGEGDALRRLARDPAVWRAAADWRDCLAGPPRLAETRYSWASPA